MPCDRTTKAQNLATPLTTAYNNPVMTPPQITARLQEKFSGQILTAFPDDKHPRIHIAAADFRPIAEFLHRDPQLKFDWMQSLSGVDYVGDDKMCVVYDLWSFDHRHLFAVKAYCPRDNPHVPSVTDLWPAADWQEPRPSTCSALSSTAIPICGESCAR